MESMQSMKSAKDMKRMEEMPAFSHEDQKVLSGRGYEIVRLLGQGAFSSVVLVRKNDLSQQRFAERRRNCRQMDSFAGDAYAQRLAQEGHSCRNPEDFAEEMACKISGRTALALREAETLAGIAHPLFSKYFGAWRVEEKVFLLMEYVRGSSLEELLARRGGFSDAQVVRIGLELAEGLKYLHERQNPVLFRDLKPANILLRQDGRVKLLDLGCACAPGRQSNLAGTPEFAAPEQLESGGFLTPASDVYGLGKTLRALTGGKCGRELKAVIASCVKERSEERIPDMRGVISALAALEKRNVRPGKPVTSVQTHAVCVNNVWESAHKRN